MATTFIEGINVRPGRTDFITIRDSISYITNPEKTMDGNLVTAFGCSPETAPMEFMMQQKEYEQLTGRKVIQDYGGKKQSYLLMTIRQSFAPGEVDEKTAHEIGCKLAERFLGGKYQYVVATHTNTDCIHNHITFNIIGNDMKKYHKTKYTYKDLREVSDKLCKEYNISVVEPSKERRKQVYSKAKETSFRTVLKNDIDKCIAIAKSYDDFLQLMSKDYFVKSSGKYLTFRHRTNGQQRNVRSYTLGEDYTEQEIKHRISRGEFFEWDDIFQETSKEKAEPVPLSSQANSFSQKIRNIQAIFATSGMMQKYDIHSYQDLKHKIVGISGKADEVQKQIQYIQNQIGHSKIILRCMDTVELYKGVAAEYETALLKDRFYQSHKNELDAYQEAQQTLEENNINYSGGEDRDNLAHIIAESEESLSDLQNQYDSLQDRLAEVNEMKRVIDKVHANEAVITKKKEGNVYDR